MRKLGTLLLAVTLLASCSESKPTENNGGSAFNITISGGTNPTYTWSEPGGLHSLSVMRTSAPTTIVWGIADSPLSATNVESPVTHGTVPTGALPSMNTEPTLTAGVQYRVSITLHNTKTAWKEFTP